MQSEKLALLIVRGGINDNTLERVVTAVERGTNLPLAFVLETNGGEPGAGYRIMRLLDANFSDINVLIPTHAWSTGTLMALGANKIHMHQSSCLGPLDLQIEHPMDGSTISSLDIRDTSVTVFSLTTLFSKQLHKQTYLELGLGKQDAAKLAMDAAVATMKPIMDKIDPYHLHNAHRSSNLGAHYAEKLLQSRMMKSDPKLAGIVANYLATAYDAHNYAITSDEASDKLALNVGNLSDYKHWDLVENAYVQSGPNTVQFKILDVPLPKPAVDQEKPKKEVKQGGQK